MAPVLTASLFPSSTMVTQPGLSCLAMTRFLFVSWDALLPDLQARFLDSKTQRSTSTTRRPKRRKASEASPGATFLVSDKSLTYSRIAMAVVQYNPRKMSRRSARKDSNGHLPLPDT
ncbi:hypothetical protein AUEXF2481DRAFT_42909 [Aureobasidium subglaciale EXF-2481]|uniref:Uncharacterized protein n=1 Tax=Aureobasidium subglaciale (strain EXF-2481) TaxID=1043005 RepID=A0A074YEB1_AURSE|nr:uncharacterized protein AUEXF2481DRAFT_42909 [Aureobasidium subglaciale EXF-2481]KEQ92462.1 hypothetical protein AUEXF2481DRAFT_42909 [Aureobasidium subglaciale EXF-2481]